MSQDKPRARKIAQLDAFASGERVMPKACLRHDDAAIGLSWLTRRGAVLSHCRVMPEACFQHDAKACKPWRFAALSLLPVMSETCFQHDTKVLASMPIQY